MSTPVEQCLGELVHFIPHRNFTKVQETVIPALFTNDCNCLVAAPTGSGKTLLLEVAMLRLFRHLLAPRDAAHTARATVDECACSNAVQRQQRRQKAVYICPIKALANEKYNHWRAQFSTLTVVIETGDQQQHRMDQQENYYSSESVDARSRDGLESMSCVSKADILVTTPERWDSITRRWKEKEVMEIVNSVGLLLLDEVHTVQEERGAAMEAIVSRVKVIQASSSTAHQHTTPGATLTRIIAISGTLPNSGDLAEWLQVSPEMTFTFSASDRPVPLTIRVMGYAHDSPNPFAFNRFLSFKIFSLMQQYSQGRPVLVFCSSRKDATISAQRIVDDIRDAAERQGQLEQLQPSSEVQLLAQQAVDKQLRSCLMMGVGFHHAAMTKEDRGLVEKMFREQYVAVICATTTLALGVNLPAHLVVIKGTTFFSNGHCHDMPVSEVMQMCGRAGRPSFDTHGMALVLTMQRNVHLYETLASGAVTLSCVESHLHRHMIEHVNAEVALRTIHSFPSAIEWVKTTFFWIRLQRCPSHYGLIFDSRADELKFNAETFVEALMERVLRVLVEEGCVHLSHTDAIVTCSEQETRVPVAARDLDSTKTTSAVFEATRLGRTMSRMYILFDTVCTFNAKLRGYAPVSTLDNTSGDKLSSGTREAGQVANTQVGIASILEAAAPATVEKVTQSQKKQPQKCAGDATGCSSPQVRPFTLRDVLQLLCHCQELVEVRLRQGDRGPLNELNKAVKYPLQSGRRGGREVREDWQKAYVLIQAHIGLLPLTEVSLRNDSLRLWAVVPRVSRFLEEYAWAASTSYSLALHSNVLARCIERRAWPDGLVLRQLKEVSDSVAKALSRSGYRTFESVANADARQLEVVCSRLPPFGTQVLCEVQRLPWISLDISLSTSTTATEGSHQNRRTLSGVVQMTLSRPGEAIPPKDILGAVRAQSSVARSSENIGGTSQFLRHQHAINSLRVLLLVGIPSEDVVLLRRFVPLTAFRLQSTTAGPSAMAPTVLPPDAQSPLKLCFPFVCPTCPSDSMNQRERSRRIEARCLVLHVVGMDTVTARDGELSDDHGVEATEHLHDSAEKPPTHAPLLARTERKSLMPYSNRGQTMPLAQTSAEARSTFNHLPGDLKTIASAGEGLKHRRSAGQQLSITHKRSRSETSAGLAAPELEVTLKGETERGSHTLCTTPLVAEMNSTEGNVSPGAAAVDVSQELPAGGQSSFSSELFSPEEGTGHDVHTRETSCGKENLLHIGVSPLTPIQQSPLPQSAEPTPSPPGDASESPSIASPSPPRKRVARVCLRRCTSPPASRPPDSTDVLSSTCYPNWQTAGPQPTPLEYSLMPTQPCGYFERPAYATASLRDARTYSQRCVTRWGGQWHPSMMVAAPACSGSTTEYFPPPHSSTSLFHRDHIKSNTPQRQDVLEQEKALYYSGDTLQEQMGIHYAVSGGIRDWSRLGCVEDPHWKHGAVPFVHQNSYRLPSSMTESAHRGTQLAQPNIVGHQPSPWERDLAASTSRFEPRQSASHSAPRPSIQTSRERPQTWRMHPRLSGLRPSGAQSVSHLYDGHSLSTLYSASQTPPWPYQPSPLLYSPLEWQQCRPLPAESASMPLWMPPSYACQHRRLPNVNSDLDHRNGPMNAAVRRVDETASVPDRMHTPNFGYAPRQIRCPQAMAAQSWWH